MERKIGLITLTVVLALLGFALAGAVAQGAPSHQSELVRQEEDLSIAKAILSNLKRVLQPL